MFANLAISGLFVGWTALVTGGCGAAPETFSRAEIAEQADANRLDVKASPIGKKTDGLAQKSLDPYAASTTSVCNDEDDCDGDPCLLGQCVQIDDEELPTTPPLGYYIQGLLAGVDSDGLLRVFGQNDRTGFRLTRSDSGWNTFTYDWDLYPYEAQLHLLRNPSGQTLLSFYSGESVVVDNLSTVSKGQVYSHDAAYSPKGELYILTLGNESSSRTPRPLRLWKKVGATWQNELVLNYAPTDARAKLRFRSDGKPEVLLANWNMLTLYRKGLDVWNSTLIYTGAGTSGSSFMLHNQNGGTSHILFATKTYNRDPSVGELILDYLQMNSSGAVTRIEHSPIGGFGHSLYDSKLDYSGNLWALVNGPVGSGARYSSYAIKITKTSVLSSVIANYESSLNANSLAIGPDGRYYLAVKATGHRPGQLRTYTPR